MYVIRTQMRDKLQEFLKNNGVSTGIHYPVPIHRQPAITDVLGGQPALRNTEFAAETVLSLPLHPQIDEESVGYVADSIQQFFKNLEPKIVASTSGGDE